MEHLLSFDTINTNDYIYKNKRKHNKTVTLNFKLMSVVSLIITLTLLGLIVSLVLVQKSKISLNVTIINLKEELKSLKEKLDETKTESIGLFNDNLRLKNKLLSLQKDEEVYKKQIKELNEKPNTDRKDPPSLLIQEFNDKTFDSNIVMSYREISFILKLIPKSNIFLKRLYRATEDGDYSVSLSRKVGRAKGTIVIVETVAGHKFGGYTEEEWVTDGSVEIKEDDNAFLFSIDKEKKYPVGNKLTAIEVNPEYLVKFNRDLIIYDKCLSNENSCSFFPKGYGKLDDKTNELTSGEVTFKVKEMEIFEIIKMN